MKKLNFTKLGKSVKKVAGALKRNSPKILMIGGAVLGAGAIVETVRATIKIKEAHDSYKHDTNLIDSVEVGEEVEIENEETGEAETVIYTAEDKASDLKINKGQYIGKVIRYAAPAVGLFTASTLCYFGAHGIMRKRNAILCATLSESFNEFMKYRKRVAEKIGDEEEKKIRYDIKDVNIAVDEETGEVISTPIVSTEGIADTYTWKIKPGDARYNSDPVAMRYIVNGWETTSNAILHSRAVDGLLGWMFLYEVLDDMCKDSDDQFSRRAGWMYDPKNPNNPNVGDNFIDYGFMPVQELDEHGKLVWVYYLTFNCDGDILSKLPKKPRNKDKWSGR